MSLWHAFLQPHTVEEALECLRAAPGSALPIAGGTDLLLDLKQGNHPPVHTLVDLTSIPEMTCLTIKPDSICIGAALPLSTLVASETIRQHAQALIEAAQLVAGPQVRNTATLGGNVAHALPAADGTIALSVLQTRAEIADQNGRRLVPLAKLFLGPGKSALKNESEILVAFHIPLRKAHQASAFKRIMRAQGIALPILNIAVWLERDSDRIQDVRISVGPGGPTPWRAGRAEQALRGKVYSSELVTNCKNELLDQVGFRSTPFRASAKYRRHLVENLLVDCLAIAWQRAEME